MWKLTYLFSLLISSLLLSSCGQQSDDSVNKAGPHFSFKGMEWMIGQWRGVDGPSEFTEEWKVQDDSTYVGKGVFKRDGNVVLEEDLVLDMNFGVVMYVVDIMGSEQGKINFTMMEKTDSMLVFTNPEHDYPQNIIYRRISKDSLSAELNGVSKGSYQREVFLFKRVPSGV